MYIGVNCARFCIINSRHFFAFLSVFVFIFCCCFSVFISVVFTLFVSLHFAFVFSSWSRRCIYRMNNLWSFINLYLCKGTAWKDIAYQFNKKYNSNMKVICSNCRFLLVLSFSNVVGLYLPWYCLVVVLTYSLIIRRKPCGPCTIGKQQRNELFHPRRQKHDPRSKRKLSSPEPYTNTNC